MANEIKKFIEKNKKAIGIIALVLFAIAVFTKNQGIDLPFFSGSLVGSATSGLFSLGALLLVIGLTISFFSAGLALPVGVPLILAGGLLAGGNLFIIITNFFNVISNPLIAISLGLLVLFFIFRKKR